MIHVYTLGCCQKMKACATVPNDSCTHIRRLPKDEGMALVLLHLHSCDGHCSAACCAKLWIAFHSSLVTQRPLSGSGDSTKGCRPHLTLVERDIPAVKDMTCIFDPPCHKRLRKSKKDSLKLVAITYTNKLMLRQLAC